MVFSENFNVLYTDKYKSGLIETLHHKVLDYVSITRTFIGKLKL